MFHLPPIHFQNCSVLINYTMSHLAIVKQYFIFVYYCLYKIIENIPYVNNKQISIPAIFDDSAF